MMSTQRRNENDESPKAKKKRARDSATKIMNAQRRINEYDEHANAQHDERMMAQNKMRSAQRRNEDVSTQQCRRS
jgi:hypothetical protein